ncbi:MFS general substrate transporter [Glarea lozoyensis ATCC 20868]|uniref:MFS general substrate transporter n=1 Tax=Glarea lozoyensis (strain ATCC 20868 / MF5171) TaxID=1116229 RepID=S3CUR7_GLAL2|nr:MFS general substrate transporter [Glarea lozoyensis ATCC 20868]EPE29375.1 MFS general substrate transporter [Glarea lozoyensis ATCC 20868]
MSSSHRMDRHQSTVSDSGSDRFASTPNAEGNAQLLRQKNAEQAGSLPGSPPDQRNNNLLVLEIPPSTQAVDEGQIVTWMSLPHKGQLALLTFARLSEPLVQSSLRSYIFYQLKSFDKTLPDSTIATQAGIITGAFAAAQLCTAILWGQMSDRRGRKSVILLGLAGATLSCIGFGFSTTFYQALIFRSLGGALNGNVGVMRTMVSEIIKEKKFQSRAFLILPMTANIGVIIGPMLGGLTSDPVAAYPGLFGGVKWLEKYPYSPPNILSAMILAAASLAVWLGMEETHANFTHQEDYGVISSRKIASLWRSLLGKRGNGKHEYMPINGDDSNTPVVELSPLSANSTKRVSPKYSNTLSLRRIFTYNVTSTLISHALLALGMGTFQSVFYTFLSTPVYDSQSRPDYTQHLPFVFTGGTGLSPREIGFSMAVLGLVGIALQLVVYPAVNTRLGTVRSWRIFLYCFPICYALTPFLALIPSTSAPPAEKTGFIFWFTLTSLILLFVLGRTFAAPAAQILLNNCCPHPTVLGTVHGIGQSASAAARTVGPALSGWVYGVGLKNGVVGITFWVLAGFGFLSCFASNFVKDGDGHEVRLDGDDEAEAEADKTNRSQIQEHVR